MITIERPCVDTAGVLSLVNPIAFSVAGSCILPHWPMAYRLRAPLAIAHTESAKIALRG